MTWPLARVAGTRLAADLGDPAFNCWVLAWTSGQILAAFRGNFGALADFWNGNIFYPEPLTIAYSEHLFGLALPILPVYAATGNILIAYNLLFIATFAMSGYAAAGRRMRASPPPTEIRMAKTQASTGRSMK